MTGLVLAPGTQKGTRETRSLCLQGSGRALERQQGTEHYVGTYHGRKISRPATQNCMQPR